MRTWTFEIKIWSEDEAIEYSTKQLTRLITDNMVIAAKGDTLVEVDLISDIESLR